jgi:two-component sensor histidine kinase
MPHTAQREVVLFGRAAQDDEASFNTVIRRLSAARSLHEVMGVVTYAVRSLLRADGATFVLRDGDRCYYAEEDAISPLWKGRRFPMKACISGWTMQHQEPAIVPDIFEDPRIPIDAYRPTFVRSLVMAPVGADRVIGAIGAYWSEPREPRREEVERLQAIAGAAALALGQVDAEAAAASDGAAHVAPGQTAAASPRRGWRALLQRVRNQGLRKRSIEPYLFAVLCVGVATLLRELVRASGVHGLVIFSTYYPAAALAMLVGGRRAGLLATLLGGLAAYYFFMPPAYRFVALSPADLVNLLLYAASCGLIIVILDRYQRAVARLREEDARHLTLAREQAHRVANAVTVMEAVVRQSLSQDPGKARLINKRLRAALANVSLSPRHEGDARSLPALFAEELQPFDLARFELRGRDATLLPPEVCGLLVLAVHELATNALKHGALSAPGGRVLLDWSTAGGGALVRWRELGGPRVEPPQSRGYGAVLLRRLVEAGGGAMTLDFRPRGLLAEISLPLPDQQDA